MQDQFPGKDNDSSHSFDDETKKPSEIKPSEDSNTIQKFDKTNLQIYLYFMVTSMVLNAVNMLQTFGLRSSYMKNK